MQQIYITYFIGIALRNENKIKLEKINYVQGISQAQTPNIRYYLIDVPNLTGLTQIHLENAIFTGECHSPSGSCSARG